MGGGAAGDHADLVVDDHAEVGEGLGAQALQTAVGGYAAAGHQHLGVAGFLEIRSDVAVHHDGGQLARTLTQLALGLDHVGRGQVVGAGRGGGAGGVEGVGTQDAGAGDVAEQAAELGKQRGGFFLVQGCSQLVGYVTEAVSAGAEFRQVIYGVLETAMKDGCDFLVGCDFLGRQIAGAAGPPGITGGDCLLRGVDKIEKWDAQAGAAGTGVERRVALHYAGLDEGGLLENPLRQIVGELGFGD